MIHQLQRERAVSALQSESVAVSAWPRVEAVHRVCSLQTIEASATPCDNWRQGKLGGRGQVDIDVSSISVTRSQEAHIVVILDKVQS